MSKTNLTSTFFRARLFERANTQFKPVFVWDFGAFSVFSDFYQLSKKVQAKVGDYKIEFYVCEVGFEREFLLDSVSLPTKSPEVLNYDHPKRYISRN